jgi:hypothetical protein
VSAAAAMFMIVSVKAKIVDFGSKGWERQEKRGVNKKALACRAPKPLDAYTILAS